LELHSQRSVAIISCPFLILHREETTFSLDYLDDGMLFYPCIATGEAIFRLITITGRLKYGSEMTKPSPG
jgi:hypothetical protein